VTTGAHRKRRAALARPSSDLGRHRGILAAGVLSALFVLLVLALRDGPRALASPGPLARPHANVACKSCHEPAQEVASCTGCHAPHASRRPAHQALAEQGSLTCGTCHAVHRAEAGVAFAANGAVTLFGTGFERRLDDGDELAPSVTPSELVVPLVSANACTSCHAGRNERDPAAHCWADPRGFSLCFDEHPRPAAGGAARHAERDAWVERARVIARRAESAHLVSSSALSSSGVPVALGLGAASFGLWLAHRRRPASSRRRPLPVVPGGRRLPVIDAARCLGCHACVDACPYDALEIRRYVAVLARPDACCGAGPCQASCPNGSLSLVTGGAPMPGPSLSPELESLARPGIFLAGDVTGGALIRNAIRQGVLVARAVAARPRSRSGACEYDLVIVGAGPAGLAAGLTARAAGLSVVVLEQAGLAASVRRFSRDKVVLDTPSDDDEKLPLFIGDAHKEELIERWQRAVREARLDVRERTRVLSVTPQQGSEVPLQVAAELDGEPVVFRARFVLVASGGRGSPRLLDVPVPDTAAGRVHYELSDARAFAGERVVVVGLGDVAMETALALAAQPGTEVTVIHRGSGFRRGSQRNIDAVSALVARGKLRLLLGARVKRVTDTELLLELAGVERAVAYDSLFVHIGSIRSESLLGAAGLDSGN
jgi:thioredoxin reductase/ferredoxin